MARKSYLNISKLAGVSFSQNLQDISITPNAGVTYTTARTLQLPGGDINDIIVSRNSSDILTNKSISGATNALTGVSLVTAVTGTLPIANGGTSAITAAGAYNVLNPMTTTGDLTYEVSNGVAARLPVGLNTQVLTVVAGSPAWSAGPQDSPLDCKNYSIVCTVAANALTISLKDKAGANPTANSAVNVSFRNSTSALGDYSTQTVSSALSLVVNSGATLGNLSAVNTYVYVYLLNNAGAVEMAISTQRFDQVSLQSTSAMSAASTSPTTLYSATARASKAVILIARLSVNNTMAGTWATVPNEISLASRFITGGTVGEVSGLLAPLGNIGELITNSASSVALASNTWVTPFNITLTPGHWVIRAYATFTNSSATSGFLGISTDSVTNSFSDVATASNPLGNNYVTSSGLNQVSTGTEVHKRVIITVSTTYYCKLRANAGASTAGAVFEAVRIR